MALKIDIKVTGSDFTIQRLHNLGADLNDWGDEFRDMGRELVDYFSGPVFDTEGGISGQRWARLSSPYEFLKRSIWPGRGILEASGKLRKGFEYHTSRTLLTIENTVMPLFAYHQKGTSKMPARVIFSLSDTLLEKLFNIVKDGLTKKMQKALG